MPKSVVLLKNLLLLDNGSANNEKYYNKQLVTYYFEITQNIDISYRYRVFDPDIEKNIDIDIFKISHTLTLEQQPYQALLQHRLFLL